MLVCLLLSGGNEMGMLRKSVLYALLAAFAGVVPADADPQDEAAAAEKKMLADCGQIEDPDRAIAACTQVIQSAPGWALAHQNRGTAYSTKGRNLGYKGKTYSDQAIVEYTKAIDLDPSASDAWAMRGYQYLYLEDLEKANADFRQALRLNPTESTRQGLQDMIGQLKDLGVDAQ